jgi:lysozyme family protein
MELLTTEAIVAWIVQTFEGAYSHDPHDPGGPTKYGVTQARLAKWRGRPVTVTEVQALTFDEAVVIHVHDVTAARLDRIPDWRLRAAIVDDAIHSGPARAVRSLQHVLGVRADGVLGPETLGALAARRDLDAVRARTIAQREARWVRIWRRDPARRVFAPSWVDRAVALLNL